MYDGSAPEVADYLVSPNEKNHHVPSNVWLVCGDSGLDLTSPTLESWASKTVLLAMGRQERLPFTECYTCVRKLIDRIVGSEPEKWIVFVVRVRYLGYIEAHPTQDTNPAFTIYTRIALCACDQLIVPCNPDDLVSAVRVITDLLRGSDNSPYRVSTFAQQARQHNVPLPKLRLVIANRFTIKAAQSPLLFAGMLTRLSTAFTSELQRPNNNDFLWPLTINGTTRTGRDVATEEFVKHYTGNVPLMLSVGVACSDLGMPITKMERGTYTVENKETRIGLNSIVGCAWAFQDIVALLEGATSFRMEGFEYAGKKLIRNRPIPLYVRRDGVIPQGEPEEPVAARPPAAVTEPVASDRGLKRSYSLRRRGTRQRAEDDEGDGAPNRASDSEYENEESPE